MTNSWKSKCPLSVLKQRAFLMSQIRHFFQQRNVLEVETPILSSAGNTDVNINSFTTEAIAPKFSKSYLRTSPEFPLKRLLCGGIGDVFELGKVFRKGELSKTHNIEFTMLEWYRIDFDYNDLIQEVKELFSSVFSVFEKPLKTSQIITFDQCFIGYLNINLAEVSSEQLNDVCTSFGYCGSELSRDEALDLLFAMQIQPKFAADILTFVTLYPASQAALAQINPSDKNTSLRFEVFYQGYELGNGYQELTDADELLSRFKNDNLIREKANLPNVRIDENLLSAMHQSMPNCSGVAVGVDRLLMVLTDSKNINDVLTFGSSNS